MSEVAALRSDSATVAFERERDAAQGVLYYYKAAAAVSEGAQRERTPSPCRFLNLAACRAPALQFAAASGQGLEKRGGHGVLPGEAEMEAVWQIHAKAGGAVLRRGHHLPVRQRLQGEYCVAPFR